MVDFLDLMVQNYRYVWNRILGSMYQRFLVQRGCKQLRLRISYQY